MRLVARKRVASRAVAEIADGSGVVVRAVVTAQEYDALAVGELPKRLTGGADGWRLVRAASGVVTFDTEDGLLHAEDWYPGDEEIPALIGTESGATVPLDHGMILAWDGEDATLSDEGKARLAASEARGI